VTEEERRQFEAARRTTNACRIRRAPMVLARTRGLSPPPIAQVVGCGVQTVRHVLHAFPTTGLAGLAPHSTRPKSAVPTFTAPTCAQRQPILPQSPRTEGKPTGLGTLALAAQVGHAQGVTARCLRDASLRRALHRLRTNWKRAKHGITSPAPSSARKKRGVIG
jgi:transposase